MTAGIVQTGRSIVDRSPGAAERDEGIARAAAHADREVRGWILLARAHLLTFARHHQRFALETVRDYAEARGLPAAPDPRAWGAVAVKCRRDFIIKPDGYAPSLNKGAHKRPTMQWQSQVYRP
jgi:hypothetical protein